ncbi:MAG: FAD-dependent oxidoreductase, partial [Pseudomonas stutzeri]|nr:FAD-dependent oxidoreductase [Stutzerimonas stutzeri]
MSAPVVIIGTGLAGYNLAREFRKLDPQTPLLLITADDGRSYSKPLLSTGFAANKDADSLGMATAGAMAEQLNAEIRTHTRVTRLDPAHRRVWIGNEPVPYRDLVLAWGAQTIRVPVEGDAADAVYPINDLHDYGRFRAAAAGKRRVLILGAGLIGCEFANDLLQGGHEVDLVAPSEQVMPGLLPLQAAEAV